MLHALKVLVHQDGLGRVLGWFWTVLLSASHHAPGKADVVYVLFAAPLLATCHSLVVYADNRPALIDWFIKGIGTLQTTSSFSSLFFLFLFLFFFLVLFLASSSS